MYTGVATNEDPKGATSPSRKPIEALRRISIQGLEPFLGRPAYDHVLLVKLIHAPCQQVAIQMLVEDGEGTAINMSLYNVIVSSTGKCTPLPDLLKVFPVGTRLAIKDPYLKVYASGMPGLRVDHVGNVLVREDGGKGGLVPLKESKELVKLFVKERGKDGGLAKLTAIKEKGNAFFAKKDVSADIVGWEGWRRLVSSVLLSLPPIPSFLLSSLSQSGTAIKVCFQELVLAKH
jgi:hypothetical protein